MKNKILDLTSKSMLEIERAIVLTDYLLENGTLKAKIYVPLYFINQALHKIDEYNSDIETIILKTESLI